MPTRVLLPDSDPLLADIYPPAKAPAPPVPRPTWSGRRRLSVVALAVLGVGLVGGAIWWNKAVTGDPGLRFEGALNVFRSRASGDMAGVVDNRNSLGHEAQVDFVRSGGFVAWLFLRNDGPRDVKVEALPQVGHYYFGLERAVTTDAPNDYFPDGDEPLEPFTLHPGDSRPLRLDFRLADCDPAGLQDGRITLTGLPVRYHTLGFSRTASVPFDEDMALSVMTIGECDHPIDD